MSVPELQTRQELPWKEPDPEMCLQMNSQMPNMPCHSSKRLQFQFAVNLEKLFTGLTFHYLIFVRVQNHSKCKDLYAELCKLFKEHIRV